MNINYKISRDEIWCAEEFINIKINNSFNLTTEQVKNKPLLDKRNEPYSKVVGRLIEADEDYIYGIMYSPSYLYDKRNESFSVEIHYEGEDLYYCPTCERVLELTEIDSCANTPNEIVDYCLRCQSKVINLRDMS